MMTLTLKADNDQAVNAINRYCLVRGIPAKCQYSKLSNTLIYAFKDDYPEGLEAYGVEYVEVN